MTATTEFGLPTVVVTPGQETSTTMTVRNDSDVVEAYEFEVVGECAPWTSVEPARLSLYPGTSGQVAVLLRPPRASTPRAGEIPLGVRVLPSERPDAVAVSETTVVVEPFGQQRAELVPQRRRAWRSARYHVRLHNEGNTAVSVALSAPASDDRLTYELPQRPVEVPPGEATEIDFRVRVGKVLWFGKSVEWPLNPVVTATGPAASGAPGATLVDGGAVLEHPLDGELVQLPVFSRWLLALLAALLALVLAWLLLVRPAIRSAAREAADDRAEEIVEAGGVNPDSPGGEQGQGTGNGNGSGQQPGTGDGGGQQPGQPGQPGTGLGAGQQNSGTIEVGTAGGQQGSGTYTVPDGKLFRITDLVVSNHQGDEGVLTISFGEQRVLTLALETFRNQDFHWVAPIEVRENATVSAQVQCARPGTPATGQQSQQCFQTLNVSGLLGDLPER
ncbi:COG1470 family protein [Actinosynnema pretiosum]|uniref:Hydrolytic protein n=1 Tax=Actinosynnema pretiosum TaxID=42197 RepID=A0A290Z606_9PSEU|nr:hydrolytic protein [Actinosynnema pretiosum]ATE54399.1 hydrolytic protein [Actinosynnema pretiosum]